MARMASAGFGMRVLAYDPGVDAQSMFGEGIEKASDLAAMLAVADFVSVHCVLNEETRHLIGAAEIAKLKPSVILINVSRGALIDEGALARAVLEGRIAGVGLDVYGQEPLAREGHPLSPLYGRDNVILFPHFTFYTREAMERLEEETLMRCVEILEGRPVLVRSRVVSTMARSSFCSLLGIWSLSNEAFRSPRAASNSGLVMCIWRGPIRANPGGAARQKTLHL